MQEMKVEETCKEKGRNKAIKHIQEEGRNKTNK
jgi:hypothetical protein